jgi:hypothetical protein
MRKALTLALLVGCALSMSATVAGASRVVIEPSGTLRLGGVIGIVAEGSSIECVYTSTWTVSRSSEGTLTELPKPERNPRIATISESRNRECLGGSIVELTGSSQVKYIYGRVVGHPEQWAMYVLNKEILVDDGLFWRCLYRLKITYIYEIRTGELRVRETIVLGQTPLTLGRCKSNPRISGVTTLEGGGGRFPTVELTP